MHTVNLNLPVRHHAYLPPGKSSRQTNEYRGRRQFPGQDRFEENDFVGLLPDTKIKRKEIYHMLMLRNLKMIFPIFFNLGMNHFKPKKVKLTKKMPGDRPAGTKVGDRFEDSTCNTHTPTKHTRTGASMHPMFLPQSAYRNGHGA